MSKSKTNQFVSRWGDTELDDRQYAIVPGFIMRHYHAAGLTADEFQVMVHIMSFKFDVEGAEAAPSLHTIAQQVGRHVSSVRRTIKRMKDRNLLRVEDRPGKPSRYDFGPLVKLCRQLESASATPSVDATPSAHASTSVDARTTPSVDASTPLAYTLAEELEIKPEDKTISPDAGAGEEPQKTPRTRSPKQLALDTMIEAIAKAMELDRTKITDEQWNEFRKAGASLIKAGATAGEMPALYQWCQRQNWKTFSSVAMAKNYANFDKDRKRHGTAQATTDPSPTLALERAMSGGG